LTIAFRNDLGADFKLVGITFRVDGTVVEGIRHPRGLPNSLPVYEGRPAVGPHHLDVTLELEGAPRAAVFSYMKGYRFQVDGTYSFVLTGEHHAADVTVVARKRSGASTPVEKQPDIGFEIRTF